MRKRAIIVPVTLTYKSVEEKSVSVANRDLVYWAGDEVSFVKDFWKLLSLRDVGAMVTIQPKIECFRYEDNSVGQRKLAEDCYNRVLSVLTPDQSDEEDLSTEEGSPPSLRS